MTTHARAARLAAAILLLAVPQVRSNAQMDGLQDKTLRLDYIFSGDAKGTSISLAKASVSEGWWGRRVNMDTPALAGNGDITLCDEATGRVLYRNSFSTLYQEWLNSEEATRASKAFENVFLVPMPKAKATVTVKLYDNHARPCATLTHGVDPADILLRRSSAAPVGSKVLHKGGDSRDCIDVAIVAEGYTQEEMDVFYKDARDAVASLFSHEPFKSMKGSFNFVAVAPPSKDSGVSVPHDGVWKETALGSHFDTFYSARYLTTLELFRLHDVLRGIPYEHIIILANTDTYGGGGIFNSYVLSAAHHKMTRPVVVHEFGHSFGGLADEYYYDDQYEQFYNPSTEPWEPNITTLVDGGAKWRDLAGKGGVGYFEGGGYMSKGVWRPCDDCRMKTNTNPAFCPVCERAVRNIILHSTVQRTK